MKAQELRGLNTVRVDKDYLLTVLKRNRDQHVNTYEQAMAAWHSKIIEILEDELRKVENDNTYMPNVYLPQPFSSKDSYDSAISLLEASLDTEFVLDRKEFNQYVMDNWSWTDNFTTTVSGCLTK